MSHTQYTFSVIDSHTGGEPTRVVYCGFPELSGSSLQEQCADFANRFDHLRRALILERAVRKFWLGRCCVSRKPLLLLPA